MLNSSEWVKVGRGKTFEFIATENELQCWLNEVALPQFAPYTIIGTDSKIINKQFEIDGTFEFSLEGIKGNMHPPGRYRENFWIRSKILTPDLRGSEGYNALDAACSLSGLILIQETGMNNQGEKVGTRIGMIDRVMHLLTQEQRSHTEYVAFYSALAKRIKEELKYSIFYQYPTGEVVEGRTPLMSEGAYKEIVSGIPYAVKPCHKVR